MSRFKQWLRGFFEIQESSSLLAYYTLYALVPLIAYLFALAHLIFKQKTLAEHLLSQFESQKQVFATLTFFAEQAYNASTQGFFATVSLALYLISVIYIFHRLAGIFDKVLKHPHRRSWRRMLIAYPLMLLLLPALALFSTGFDFFLSTSFQSLRAHSGLLNLLLFIPLRLLPYLFITLFFFIIYTFIPSKRSPFIPTLISSLIAALFYKLFQWGFAYFQLWSLEFNPIYGTFAIFPLFLLWIDLSWLNVLAGAKIIALLKERSQPLL